MSKVVTKLDDELRLGAMLGSLKTDNDKLLLYLRNIIGELGVRLSDLECGLQVAGVAPTSDGRYNRYLELRNLFYGIYYALLGVSAMLVGVEIELMSEFDDNKSNKL